MEDTNQTPEKRTGHCMEFFQESLYIFGGINQRDEYISLAIISKFDLKTGNWTKE
jgi:hypothetical protein